MPWADSTLVPLEPDLVTGNAALSLSPRALMVGLVAHPADSHVHTEWSWDAPRGSMRASCERALQLGLPAIAFTDHVDHTVWRADLRQVEPDHPVARLAIDGHVHPLRFDAAGYLTAIARCREQFPDLTILSGLEVGEPHRYPTQVADVLSGGDFDRVLGSVHTLAAGDGFEEPGTLFDDRAAADVVRSYLAEVALLVVSNQPFQVLAHIDYPVRSWPPAAAQFDPADFEEEFRHVLRLTADSGRALEVNTTVPLHATILAWWHEEGGAAITFGSDAHEPATITRGFTDAVHLAEARGFRPNSRPHDLWGRVD